MVGHAVEDWNYRNEEGTPCFHPGCRVWDRRRLERVIVAEEGVIGRKRNWDRQHRGSSSDRIFVGWKYSTCCGTSGHSLCVHIAVKWNVLGMKELELNCSC